MLSIREREIRLYQLGYYNKNVHPEITNDNIDGVQGSNFKKALTWFQTDNKIKIDGCYGPESNSKLIEVYDKFMKEPINWNDKVLANFKQSEFKCSCCGKNLITKQIVYNIQAMRHYLGVPVKITSGYRCASHNKKVGGASNSRHLNGKAVDFYSTKSDTLNERKNVINFYINYFPNTRYAYCNKYGKTKSKVSYPSSKTMGNATHIDVN